MYHVISILPHSGTSTTAAKCSATTATTSTTTFAPLPTIWSSPTSCCGWKIFNSTSYPTTIPYQQVPHKPTLQERARRMSCRLPGAKKRCKKGLKRRINDVKRRSFRWPEPFSWAQKPCSTTSMCPPVIIIGLIKVNISFYTNVATVLLYPCLYYRFNSSTRSFNVWHSWLSCSMTLRIYVVNLVEHHYNVLYENQINCKVKYKRIKG